MLRVVRAKGMPQLAPVQGFLAEGKVLLQWADGDANDRKKSPEVLR